MNGMVAYGSGSQTLEHIRATWGTVNTADFWAPRNQIGLEFAPGICVFHKHLGDF